MKDSNGMRLVGIGTILAGTLPWTWSCTPVVPGPDDAAPPDIPPASTFVMDFSDFDGEEAPKLAVDWADPATMQAGPGGNWTWAATNVGVWNLIVMVGLAVPVTAFLESFNHVPAQEADGSWVWSYEVNVGGVMHTAELHALAVAGDIEWDMFISKEGFYTDFNWFSGVSNLIGTEGTWTLNKGPDDPGPLVGIDWHRNPANETGDIRYTNIVPDGPENGGYIFHGITIDPPFDAFYEIYNQGRDNLTEIEWNRTTKDGQIRDPWHFDDDDWHCWDAALQNLECSPASPQ